MKSRLIHLGLAIAALLAAPVAAQAADLSPSYKAPAYVSPAFSWSGFYVGANVGYGFGTADAGGGSADLNGIVAGGTLGYNLQTGSWVWGIEGDFNYSGMKDETAGVEARVPWFGTLRGRIGYAGWNSLMPYITGGATYSKLEIDGGGSDQRIGWTIGAGLEYALFNNWSVKLEYLYADLGSFDMTGGSVDVKTNIVRAGVNYRF